MTYLDLALKRALLLHEAANKAKPFITLESGPDYTSTKGSYAIVLKFENQEESSETYEKLVNFIQSKLL